MDETIIKKQSLGAMKCNAVGFVLCILTIIIVAYGINWYYENKLSPSEIDGGIDVTTSKSYQEFRVQMIKHAELDLKAAKNEYERWLALENLALFLVDEDKMEEAHTYAKEFLDLAPTYRDSWNYGNAIHIAHIALGRIALRHNNLNEAKKQLLDAGRTPGSPQLDSFGPNMLLAKELLEKGERDVVLEYIKLCRNFWKSDKAKMDIWQQIIREGRIPDFGSNLL